MDLSQLTESELQQLANVGNFSALGELANRRNTTTRSMESIEKENIRNAIARNLAADSQGTIKTFNMSQDNLKSNMLDNDNESQNDGAFIPEEETGVLSLRDILADLGRKGVEGFKDIASRGVASKVYGGAGTMLTGNPLIGGIASLAGLVGGGNMFNQSYDNSFKEFATPDMSPYGMGSSGLSHLQDKYGKNTVSARGNYGKMALDTFFNLTERSKKGPMGKHLQDKKDYYGNIVNKINSKLTDANDYGSGVDGDTTASGGPQSMGSAKGGAGGRPY